MTKRGFDRGAIRTISQRLEPEGAKKYVIPKNPVEMEARLNEIKPEDHVFNAKYKDHVKKMVKIYEDKKDTGMYRAWDFELARIQQEEAKGAIKKDFRDSFIAFLTGTHWKADPVTGRRDINYMHSSPSVNAWIRGMIRKRQEFEFFLYKLRRFGPMHDDNGPPDLNDLHLYHKFVFSKDSMSDTDYLEAFRFWSEFIDPGEPGSLPIKVENKDGFFNRTDGDNKGRPNLHRQYNIHGDQEYPGVEQPAGKPGGSKYWTETVKRKGGLGALRRDARRKSGDDDSDDDGADSGAGRTIEGGVLSPSKGKGPLEGNEGAGASTSGVNDERLNAALQAEAQNEAAKFEAAQKAHENKVSELREQIRAQQKQIEDQQREIGVVGEESRRQMAAEAKKLQLQLQGAQTQIQQQAEIHQKQMEVLVEQLREAKKQKPLPPLPDEEMEDVSGGGPPLPDEEMEDVSGGGGPPQPPGGGAGVISAPVVYPRSSLSPPILPPIVPVPSTSGGGPPPQPPGGHGVPVNPIEGGPQVTKTKVSAIGKPHQQPIVETPGGPPPDQGGGAVVDEMKKNPNPKSKLKKPGHRTVKAKETVSRAKTTAEKRAAAREAIIKARRGPFVQEDDTETVAVGGDDSDEETSVPTAIPETVASGTRTEPQGSDIANIADIEGMEPEEEISARAPATKRRVEEEPAHQKRKAAKPSKPEYAPRDRERERRELIRNISARKAVVVEQPTSEQRIQEEERTVDMIVDIAEDVKGSVPSGMAAEQWLANELQQAEDRREAMKRSGMLAQGAAEATGLFEDAADFVRITFNKASKAQKQQYLNDFNNLVATSTSASVEQVAQAFGVAQLYANKPDAKIKKAIAHALSLGRAQPGERPLRDVYVSFLKDLLVMLPFQQE